MYRLLVVYIALCLCLNACNNQHVQASTFSCDGVDWFNDDFSEALRTEENVINLACLGNGWVMYHKLSLRFDSTFPWTKITSSMDIEVHNTQVRIRRNGEEYVLNVFQPFVIQENPNWVYIVDLKGELWQCDLQHVDFIPISTQRSGLPVYIPPNPQLSVSYDYD